MKCFSAAVKPDDATCGSPTWIGKGLTCVCFKRKGAYERICINLTPQQAKRLKRLKHRMKVYFDASRPDHQDALRALWSATYPDRELSGLISDQWKEMGWQGRDPSTDFRGAGFISLENLLFFAKTFSASFQQLLKKQGGKRSAWEYPFAVAGVNITFMIMQMLDLDAMKPRTFVRSVFLQILSENEWAFDLLYCVAFAVMDNQWLQRNATHAFLQPSRLAISSCSFRPLMCLFNIEALYEVGGRAKSCDDLLQDDTEAIKRQNRHQKPEVQNTETHTKRSHYYQYRCCDQADPTNASLRFLKRAREPVGFKYCSFPYRFFNDFQPVNNRTKGYICYPYTFSTEKFLLPDPVFFYCLQHFLGFLHCFLKFFTFRTEHSPHYCALQPELIMTLITRNQTEYRRKINLNRSSFIVL
ncbi:ENGULFMENT AND CELL MOTILITY [Salix viminalis]|uniref:ENGULFMENT AND CELL MOTILITY n=1 Tax=Salix viminalis TaxID=40686 RepID=A0A9Q0Z544_SALVM|nr:ENGULFMENT AND CELL MOTILITY [Salix viminalis]